MELTSIIEILRRRRIALATGVAVALAAAALASGVVHRGASAAPSGQALAQVLVNTRPSLIAAARPGGQDTIVQRSVLLAALMGSSATTDEIARRAGINPLDLFVRGPALLATSEFGLLPDGQFPQVASTSTLTAVHTPDVVSLQPNYNLPIIQIGAAAPTIQEAVALAQATVATLQSATEQTNPPTARAGATAGDLPPLEVDALGGVTSAAVVTTDVHLMLGVAAAIGIFLVWCAGLVISAGIGRMWRTLDRPVSSMAG